MAQHIPFHPAVGFGDLPSGWHIVPQNPIKTPGTPLVPSIQATAPNRILRRPRLQELVAGGFTVPQNPLRAALGDLMPGGFTLPQNPINCGGMGGLGCGCGGGCGGGQANYTLNGLGDLSVSSVTDWLQAPSDIFPGVSNWVFALGTILAVDLYFSHGRGSRGKK